MIESKGHKITPIDGDLAVSRNAEIGGDADIHGKARVAGSLKVEGFLDAPHIKGAAKGLFNSVEELTREYPNPRPGWFAIVLDATNKEKGILYKAENRGWVATTDEAKPYEFIKDSINVFASKGELADETQRAQGAERILTQIIVNETGRATEAENEIKKNAVKVNRIGITRYADNLELMAATIDGDEVRYIDIPAATETKAGVVSAEDKKKFVKSITWNNDTDPSNMNDFVTAGVYDIKGEHTRKDNLPILNTGGGHSFNARLTVLDSSITGSGNNDDKCITQVLSFSNRLGQGEVYIRTGKGSSLDNLSWEKWSTLQRNVNVEEVTTLNNLVDNGIYSGVWKKGALLTDYETFVLVVINDYAIAGDNKRVSQFKYGLDIYGKPSYKSRYYYIPEGYTFPIWTGWEILNKDEISSMIKAEIADLVGTAPETLDTLQEIAEWVSKHQDLYGTLKTLAEENTKKINEEITRAIETEARLGEYISNVEKSVDKTNTDLTETKKNIASSLHASCSANSMDITGKSDVGRTTFSVNISAATTEKAGVMSANDKVKLDASIKNVEISPNTDDVELDLEDNTDETTHIMFPAATTEYAGVMTAEDKTSLTRLIDNAEGKTIDIASLVYESNKYMLASGAIKSQSGFFLSDPVLLTKGSKVSLSTNSTNAISVITRTTKEGDFFSCVAVGKKGNNTYEWTAPIDCYIRLTVTAKQGTIELKGLTEKVEKITTDVHGNSYGVKSVYGIVSGAFLSNGNIGYVDSYSRSNPIPVKEGDVVKITGASSTAAISLITSVSEDNEYLSTIMSGAQGVSEFEYSVAADGYISVSMSKGSYTDESAVIITKGLVDEIEKIKEHSGSLWSGKRIMAIGDSLTASTKKTNWQYIVGDLLNCKVRTHAKGGIGLITMVDGDGTEKPEADPDNFGVENIYRLEADDVADVDMILLFGAFNEYRRARDEYGTMTDVYPTQDTYLGKLRYVANRLVETVLEGNPKCKIAFIEPYCFGGGGYCNATGYDVGVDMARGMREVAEEFCFPCIPLLRNSQIARYNWDLYCAGAGKENTTYLPYEESVPYGTPSIFPSADELPSIATEGVIALVASDNTYGYTYAQFKDGVWSLNHWPGGSAEYPVPYIYLWKDFIHLNADGHERIAKYIAGQVNTF